MLWTRMRQWLEATLQRSRMEKEMDDEMRFHIDARIEDLMNRGLSAEEAARRARLCDMPRVNSGEARLSQ